jgi:AraC-like DNA-binding protein
MQKRQKSKVQSELFSVSLPDEFPINFFIEDHINSQGPYTRIPHFHNLFEISYCHQGEGVFTVGEKIIPFKAGDAMVINGQEAHVAQNRKGTQAIWTWIFTDIFKLLSPVCKDFQITDTTRLCGKGFNNILMPTEHPAAIDLITRIIKERKAKGTFHEHAVRGLMLALMVYLQRLKPREEPVIHPDIKEEITRLMPALNFMRDNYTQKVYTDHLARLCSMCPSGFRQHFRKVMGASPYQYLNHYRVAMAGIELKEGKKSVENIALDNGFPTLSCFVRTFKKIYGVAPRRWAKKQK